MSHPSWRQTPRRESPPRREPTGRPLKPDSEIPAGNRDGGGFQHKGKARILTGPSRHWLVLDTSHLQNFKPSGARRCG